MLGLKSISLEEMDALWGSLGSVAELIPGGRAILAQGCKKKRQMAWMMRKSNKYVMPTWDWLKNDLRAFQYSMRSGEGCCFMKERKEVECLGTDIVSITDAAWSLDESKFSGMGGIIKYQSVVVMWHYKYDMEELKALRIHGLEMWAEVTAVALLPVLKEAVDKTEQAWGAEGILKERVDNMSVVDVIKGSKAKDATLVLLRKVRNRVVATIKWQIESSWIWTHDPAQLGDGLSRGKIELIRKQLISEGFQVIVEVDLREYNPIQDFQKLRGMLINEGLNQKSAKSKGHLPYPPNCRKKRSKRT